MPPAYRSMKNYILTISWDLWVIRWLREDDQATQARGLIHSIEDEKVRSLVKAQVALHMVGLKPKELDLPAISSSNGANN
jgi:hypothetical protein